MKDSVHTTPKGGFTQGDHYSVVETLQILGRIHFLSFAYLISIVSNKTCLEFSLFCPVCVHYYWCPLMLCESCNGFFVFALLLVFQPKFFKFTVPIAAEQDLRVRFWIQRSSDFRIIVLHYSFVTMRMTKISSLIPLISKPVRFNFFSIEIYKYSFS